MIDEDVIDKMLYTYEDFTQDGYKFQCPKCLSRDIHVEDGEIWCGECFASTSYERATILNGEIDG